MKKLSTATKVLNLGLVLALALAGCGNDAGGPAETSGTANGKPETKAERPADKGSAGSGGKQEGQVTLAFWGRHMSKSQFESEVKGPLEKKFPGLSLNYLSSPAQPGTEDPLIKTTLAGDGPDIVLGPAPSTLGGYKEAGILADLTPYIKQFSVDLGVFENAFMEEIRAYGSGALLALPYKRDWSALFYNMDLFDRFGAAYPKDGMSWDEVVELSRKLTVQDGGREYYGLEVLGYGDQMRQLGLKFVDESSGKAAVSSPAWIHFLSVMRAIPQVKYILRPNEDEFIRLQVTAMSAGRIDRFREMFDPAWKSFRWDVVTYPIFPETGMVVPGGLQNYLGLNAQSKHKEEAFQVIRHLVSREFQLDNSRKGIGSVLRDEQVHREFASMSEAWKGKNIQALFKYRPQSLGIPGELDNKVSQGGVGRMLSDIIQNREDPKAAVEKLEREINRILAQ
jgi:multiple sugar transport system substrate-binding protein